LKQKVLKALANPPRIFYVPYSLAILNFIILFMLFIVAILCFLLITGNIPTLLPLIFIGILCLTHSILGIYSKKDSQIAQLIFSSFFLFKNKVPRKLVV